MAGGSAVKLEIGYCAPWLAIVLQRGKRMACFSSYSFCILVFYAEGKVPHVTVIPILWHTAFYFPPPANKDRAVNSMEIKDFIILWTYSQWRQALVVIPPFLSRTGNVSHAFLFLAFLFLRFRKVEEVQHIIVIPSEILCKTTKNDFPTYGKSFFVSLVFSCKAGGFAPFRAAVYKRSLPLLIRILP